MPLFRPGTTIGRYSVVERLSQGGMGTVYLALDQELDRLTVIKVMLDADADASLRARFLREARAAASLRHANIVTIYEVGEHQGHAFIAMEYVAGETVADLISRRDPLPVYRKLEIVEQICAGLQHAHRSGVIHRDIKPANVMLDGDGVVRILDFGIARTVGSGMTREGSVIGTLNYMSPEQMAGTTVDQRSDIFSLGAVAYELIAYQKAFVRDMLDGVAHRQQSMDPEPLSVRCPGIDPAIERVISRALKNDPDERYSSVALMQDDMRRIRSRMSSTDTIPPRTPPSEPTAIVSDYFLRRRLRQIQSHLTAAERSFELGELQTANEACEEALVLDPEHGPANELHGRILAAMAGVRARNLLDEARQAIERDALTEAEQRVAEAAALDPHAARLSIVRREIEEQRIARERRLERERMIRRSLEDAETRVETGALEAALRTLAEVLAVDPENPAALALRVRAEAALRDRENAEREAAEAVLVAYERFAAGEHEGALKHLEGFRPPSAAVLDALQILRGRREETLQAKAAEEARRESGVASALTRFAASLTAGDFAQALRAADEALVMKPDGAEALAARSEALRQQEIVRKRSEIERHAEQTITRALREFARGNEQEAMALLTAFGSEHPRVDAALTNLKTRAEQDARRREGADELIAARHAMESGAIESAREHLTRAQSLGASDIELEVLRHSLDTLDRDTERNRHRASEQQRLIEAVQTSIQEGELDRAWESLEAAALEAPTDPKLAVFRAMLERLEMIAAALTRAEKTPSHEAAVVILTEALSLDPSHEGLRGQLKTRQVALEQERAAARAARERQEKIAAALARAEKTPSHEAAVAVLSEVVALDPAHDELRRQLEIREAALEQERAAVRVAQERQQKIAAALTQAEKTPSHEAAVAVLSEVVALDPAHDELRRQLEIREAALEQERAAVRAAQERQQTIAAALTQAEKTPSHEAAVAILSEVVALNPAHDELRRQLEIREAALEQERAAVRVAQERQQKIAAALTRVEKTPSHEAAVVILTEALSLDPSHEGLRGQLKTRQVALEQERAAVRAAQERQQKIAAALARAEQTPSHEVAVAILTEVLALDPSHKGLRRQLEVRQAALEQERADARAARERQEKTAAALAQAKQMERKRDHRDDAQSFEGQQPPEATVVSEGFRAQGLKETITHPSSDEVLGAYEPTIVRASSAEAFPVKSPGDSSSPIDVEQKGSFGTNSTGRRSLTLVWLGVVAFFAIAAVGYVLIHRAPVSSTISLADDRASVQGAVEQQKDATGPSAEQTASTQPGAALPAAEPPAIDPRAVALQAAKQQSAAQSAAAQQAAEQQTAALQAAEQQAAAQQAAEQQAAEQQAAERRAADQRAGEQRAADQRAADQRAAEQRAADQRAAAQRAADQRAAEQRAAMQRVAAEQSAVRGVLEDYEQAYNNLDIAAVRRVFPSQSEALLRRAFAEIRSQRVQMQDPVISITDATAVIDGIWNAEITPRAGQPQRTSVRLRLELHKDGGTWIVVGRK